MSATPVPATPPVQVVRSLRRRKTVEARLVDGVLRISVPAALTHEEERHWVAEMTRRHLRKHRSAGVDLPRRAAELARRFDLPQPAAIRWVDNQHTRWGSCTVQDATIRVSRRLAEHPRWVLDFVIVHELAHLAVPDHSPAFAALVDRYPKAERARGYLIAVGGGRDDA